MSGKTLLGPFGTPAVSCELFRQSNPNVENFVSINEDRLPVLGMLCCGALCAWSFCGGGCTVMVGALWWFGHCVVGHCVLGHCVVGNSVVRARCGGYAMVVNVPNRAQQNGKLYAKLYYISNCILNS